MLDTMHAALQHENAPGGVMYRFLMVDDEEIVRRGFGRKIDWEGLGFQYLDPCEDGEQAIEAIAALHPDVVMTDIYMPRVDGLAVAEYIAERHPEIVIVILSGYDEFEYAQKAIRSKVFEYVLKPVTSRDLNGLLARLKAKLDADSRSRQDVTELKERAVIAADVLRTRSLVDLVSGALPVADDGQFEKLFGFSPRGLACAAIVAENAPRDPAAASPSVSLHESLRTSISSSRWALPFLPGEERAAALIFQADQDTCDIVTGSIAGKLAAARGASTIVGVGRTYASWVDASRTYDEATAALAYRLVSGPGRAFTYAQPKGDDPAVTAELKARCDRLSRATISGEAASGVDDATRQFFHSLEEARLSPQRVRHELDSLFAAIIDGFAGLGISAASLSRDLDLDYYQSVKHLRTMEESTALLARLCGHARLALKDRNLPLPEWKAKDLQSYVARHYSDKDLSLSSAAKGLSISASYLSKLAKRFLGQSFVEYVTAFRMAQARELLSTTDLMTHEIAEATGFGDAGYFSSLFRRHEGITPSEFRRQRRRKSTPPQ
jgi:two-component system response regulator YesN